MKSTKESESSLNTIHLKEINQSTMASPTRMVNITGDGAEIIRNRIEERGYSSFNDHLISQKIYNILAKAVYSNKTPISLRKVLVTELQKIKNDTKNREELATNANGVVDQEEIYNVKINIAKTLAEIRKNLWDHAIKNESELEKQEVIHIFDAVEYADEEIDSYKPSANKKRKNKETSICMPVDFEDAVHMLQPSIDNKRKKRSKIDLVQILVYAGIISTLSYFFLSNLTAWLALKLGIPFIFVSILITTIILLIFQYQAPDSEKKIAIKLNDVNENSMKKIYENHWSFASIPGRIAEFIANNPVKAATYSTITLLLTITLTSTVIGQNLVLTIAGLAGISFYCSLYILIITGFCMVMAADKTIESLIYPSQKKQENTEKFKPYNINPIARLWQAIDLFLSKFYVLGMQNPISMLFFTILYIGITIEVAAPFLPTLGHNIVYFFVTGIANPSAGLIFAGVCTGWFIGLFLLSVTDLITRQHDSGLVSSINYVKNNAIDAALFFMILMFSANVVAGTSLAHICGKWVILGLLTINFKPLLAIADFMNSPKKSIIGSSFSSLLLPTNIILYPGELLKYFLKKSLHIIFGILKHFLLHVPLVLLRALADITAYTLIFFNAKKAATNISNAYIDIHLMVKLSIIKIKYFGKRLIKKTSILTNNLGKLCHVSFAIFGSVMSYIGLFYIWSGSLPKIAIYTWLGYPFNFLAGFIGISAAATALTTLGAFVMFLSTHQLVSKKTQYSPEEAQFTFFQQITFALLLIVTSGLIFFHPPLYPYMVVATILTTLLTTIVSSLVFSAKICITASKPIGGSSSSELFETQANTTNLKINDSNLELNADNNDTKNNQIGASISPEEKKNR